MADMAWLDEIELYFEQAWPGFPSPTGRYVRKLIAAVRLAEKKAHHIEQYMDAERTTRARLELSDLVTRLRSGEVEGK